MSKTFIDPDAPSTKWQVYKKREGLLKGCWIIRPPGADFVSSYSCSNHRRALQFALDKAFGR